MSHSVSPLCFRAIFESLGLPKHTYDAVECEAITGETSAWHTNVARPETIGTCLTMPLKLHVIPFLDELTDRAQSIGGVNTTVLVDQPDGSVKHIGDNTDPSGISGVLLSAFTGHESPVDERTPSSFRNGTVAGVIIGMSREKVSARLLMTDNRKRRCCESESTTRHRTRKWKLSKAVCSLPSMRLIRWLSRRY